MWSAFVTGFATKATELIEERDKEIQDTIKVQLSEMFKSRQKALQASETRNDTLRKTASQLRGYGLPDAAIGEIITSGDSETITELLQKEAIAGTLTPEKVTKFLGERSGKQPSEALDTIIKRFSTPVKSTTRMPLAKEMKGAFGLPTRAADRTVAETVASTGMTLEELQATEMPEIPLTAQKFDFSVLSDGESTFAKTKDRARQAVLSAEEGSPEYKAAMSVLQDIIKIENLDKDSSDKTFAALESTARTALFNAKTPEDTATATASLNRVLAIKAIGKRDEEGIKESDVRSNLRILDATIKQSMAGPGDLVTTKDDQGNLVYEYSKSIKPEVRARIEKARSVAFKGYAAEHYALEGGKLPPEVRRVMSAFIMEPAGEATPAQPGGQPAPAKPQKPAPSATGTVTVTHNNRTYTFPNQAAANNFKRDMGIQ